MAGDISTMLRKQSSLFINPTKTLNSQHWFSSFKLHSFWISSPSTLLRIVVGCDAPTGFKRGSSFPAGLGPVETTDGAWGLEAAVLASAANETPSFRNDDRLGDFGEITLLGAGAAGTGAEEEEGGALPLAAGVEP